MQCEYSRLGDPLSKIFSYLNEDDLTNASLTCKSWYDYATDDALWKNLLQNRGTAIEDHSTAKKQVFEYCKRYTKYFVSKFPDIQSELFPKIADTFRKCFISSQSTSYRMVAKESTCVFKDKIAVDRAIQKKLSQELLNQELSDTLENGTSEEQIIFLIEAGAHVTDRHLDISLSCGKSLEIVKLLIQKGAKPLENSLDYALMREYPHDIILLLLDKGATKTENTSYYLSDPFYREIQ